MTDISEPKKPNYGLYSFLLILLLTLILSTIGVLYYLDHRPTSEITVNGKSSRTVKYDKVTLNFYIQERGADLVELNSNLDNNTKKTTDYLLSVGISKDKIQTNKSSFEDYIPLPNANDNYKVSVVQNQVTVKIEDLQNKLDLPNKITSEVVKYDVKRFDTNNYEITNKDQICDEIKDKAISDAKQKAEKRVASLGNGKIISTKIQDYNGCENIFPTPVYFDKSFASGVSAPQNNTPDVFAGEKEITQDLTLVASYR
jgi:uncharacterized protein YggE